jgi:hypothetical protein
MKARRHKPSKDEAFLMSVAQSVGSTLGTIAAKADAAQKAITCRTFVDAVERKGKKLVRKGKGVARETRKAARSFSKSKLARAAHRGVRRAASSLTQTARRAGVKVRAARRNRSRR